MSLTEGANLGRAIATAMTLVEEHNPELRGVLPRGYTLLPNATLIELLRLLSSLDLEGDAFGKVYEYFLGNFALKEGQKGGVFYMPTSILRLIGEAADYINRGLAPKYEDAASGIVINQKCIRDQRLNLGEARRQSKKVPADKVVRDGDVLINSTGVGTLGRVAQVLFEVENCTVDTHVSIVRPGAACDPDLFGLALLGKQAHFEAQGVGSTGQTELSRERIGETPLVLPPIPVQKSFAAVVGPMRRLAVKLQEKNTNLRTTRDLLLPKLISGELDVSALAEPEV